MLRLSGVLRAFRYGSFGAQELMLSGLKGLACRFESKPRFAVAITENCETEAHECQCFVRNWLVLVPVAVRPLVLILPAILFGTLP